MLAHRIIQHHKKKSLEALEFEMVDVEQATVGAADAAAGEALVAGASSSSSAAAQRTTSRPSSRSGQRAISVKRRSGSAELDSLERQERGTRSDPAETLQGSLRVDGRHARVSLSATGLEWTTERGGCCGGASTSETLPFSEMLTVQTLEQRRPCWGLWPSAKAHCLVIFTFRRGARRRADWAPRRVVLQCGDPDAARDWATAISAGIDAASSGRPRSLLVVLNPKAGNRRSRVVYSRIVAAVFAAGGIKTTVVESEWSGHAAALVRGMALPELLSYDGIVGVGGDGVFHELTNGLLALRASYGASAPLALLDLRLAHIPAGSTDAVACTLHGTRSVFSAAMHVALGDRTALDALRLDTPAGGPPTFSSCMASYGFMGDVMANSEVLRWIGPFRYDLVGTAMLLRCKAYPARVSYIRGSYMAAALQPHQHKASQCGTNCEVCKAASRAASVRRLSEWGDGGGVGGTRAGDRDRDAGSSSEGSIDGDSSSRQPAGAASRALALPSVHASGIAPAAGGGGSGGFGAGPLSPSVHDFLHPAHTAAQRHEEDWVSVDGEFVSIMLLNMPCISEKTRDGIVRSAHLADGTIKVVLVRKCGPLRYFRFLLDMTKGLRPGQHSYVEIIDAAAVKIECPERGPLSHWNLDGELLSTRAITGEIHQGLIQVFARGVER